jgi:hypothetical protein
MPFYGDFGVSSLFSQSTDVCGNSLATAIITIYTTEGFVIAADMRKARHDGTTISSKEQKIFPIQGKMLAYAVGGTVQITKDDLSEELGFDLLSAIPSRIDGIGDVFSLRRYGRLACFRINEDLEDAKKSGRIQAYPEEINGYGESGDHIIATVFFTGYYKDEPGMVYGRFEHDNQELLPPHLGSLPLVPGIVQGYGSPAIMQLLNSTEDQTLADYRDQMKPEERSIINAIELAKGYFRACLNPEIRKLDEKHCASLSEKIYIATIKRDAGFQRVSPPEGADVK